MNHEPLRSLGLELFQLLTQPISQRAWSSLLGQRECRNFAPGPAGREHVRWNFLDSSTGCLPNQEPKAGIRAAKVNVARSSAVCVCVCGWVFHGCVHACEHARSRVEACVCVCVCTSLGHEIRGSQPWHRAQFNLHYERLV